MRFHFSTILIAVFFCAFVTACGGESTLARQERETDGFIVAVNSPLQYFAQYLVGNELEVRMLAPAGTDPAQWQPNIEDILQLQQAELILLNGAGYSDWLNKVSLPEEQLIITSAVASDKWIPRAEQVSHSHGPQGEHAHSGYTFTTWMDMSLAQVQAKAVADALLVHWPEKREGIEVKLTILLAELESVDRGYAAAADRLRRHQIIYSHPVYQYFERRYDIPGISLHWEPDVIPGDEQWNEFQSIDADTVLFVWEAEPSPDTVERMDEMGIEFVVVDPAAKVESDRWLSLQQENMARLNAHE
jgi:zinc transport system substrate-binding protein